MAKKFFLSGLINRNKINTFFKRNTKRKMYIAGGIFLFIVILIIVIIALVNRVNWDKAKSPILDKGMVSIGLRTDLQGFALKNEQSGEIEGLEKDIAAEIVKRLFKEERINVEYKEINSKTGKVYIQKGDLDFTLGAYIETNTESYLDYSDPYYTDATVFYARQGSITKAEDINGKKMGVVSTSYAGYNKKLEEFLKSRKINCEYKYFNAYPDAMDALKAGQVDVIAGSRIIMQSYAAEAYEVPGFVLLHGYRIAVKKTNIELKKALNSILNDMRRDNTLDGLKIKWQLVDYDK